MLKDLLCNHRSQKKKPQNKQKKQNKAMLLFLFMCGVEDLRYFFFFFFTELFLAETFIRELTVYSHQLTLISHESP